MSNPLVYLCGPITDLSYDEARLGWRKWVDDELALAGIDCLSPMRDTDHITTKKPMHKMGDPKKRNIRSTPRYIKTRDKWDCKRCDLLFANFLGYPSKSIGSILEIAWAEDAGNPVIIAMEDDNPHQHAMINEIGIIVPNLEISVQVIKSFLLPGV